MKRIAVIALSVLALGLAGCADTQAQAEPAPTVTVTAKPEIKEVEVIKEVTPPSCIQALDLASDAVEVFVQITDTVSPALQAAATWDNAALEALTSKIQRHNQEITDLTAPMSVAVSDCRGSAQ